MLFLLFFAVGCQSREEVRIPPEATGNLSAKLSSFTPEGWTLYDQVLQFTAENLYEQIDGRAEFYLAYDMVRMSFASYEKDTDEGQFIDVSVYDMGTPTHAFGVFSGERTKGAPSIELGRDAYRSGANYYLWKGQYYIQIVASDTADELQRIGLDIAREVTGVLQDSGQPVWGLQALPEDGRVHGSERYFLVDAMGLDFMRNTYIAEYTKSGIVTSVFLSQRDSPELARAAVDSYVEYANQYGEGVERLTVDGVELVSCDMGGSYDMVFQNGRLVGGATGIDDQNIAIQAAVDLSHFVEVSR
jgi:hypothetical protein